MRLFFFSSRRRHTRFDCDWSSDVCSSDLAQRPPERVAAPAVGDERDVVERADLHDVTLVAHSWGGYPLTAAAPRVASRLRKRSEERRVGKEGTSWCSAWR